MTLRQTSIGGIALLLGLLAIPATASAQAACDPAYRIGPGDTLARVARLCNVSPDALRRANPRTQWDRLRIGAVVEIPNAGPRRPLPGRGADVYVIRPGDTLRSVARALGVDVNALLDANPGLSQRDLVPGREIRLGGRGAPRPPVEAEIDLSIRERDAEPGGFVTVEIEGLPPRAPVSLRAGPEGSRLSVERNGRSGRDGSATVEIDIPERARPGDVWRVEALDPRGRPVASARVRIAGQSREPGRGPDRGFTVSGLLTREGVECPALRSADGELYTLSGRIGGFRPGDTVTVSGRPTQRSICQQGTTIEVERIEQSR
ncbi:MULTISPECIES: LysM peptidoglycan-binding domain-containing protein [unclassified Aureimonas]|uniref:LysM peptidoglycan-binding domain-containing protein n=1 Tax=unclassified Aureimonas TaxID=2615206 RepID=UPI0006F6CC0F|nr:MULTISPECIES: LysM peptidoglycan-binding domain-containing protein [unclassified Aureimonas]KQT69631.1 hypothetical protein ASG62_00375 [Aureimonas sp. Leaf427]KQT80982.1 hypothetical protein ASG54_05905 [Aureimonas sp. Leaf460]